MPKVMVSFPSRLHEQLVERCEEEGVSTGSLIREAVVTHLGLTDAKPKREILPQYGDGGMERFSLSLPEEWVWELGMMAEERTTDKKKVSVGAVIREMVREALGKPVPEVLPRAPRDPNLSRDIILEHQIESFNDMRNLRTSQEGQPEEQKKVWDRIRENPEEFFHVNHCRVAGCHNDQMGLHRHPGMHLATYADEVEAGGMT